MMPAWPFLIGIALSLAGLIGVLLRPVLPALRQLWFVIACIVGIAFGTISSRCDFRFVAESGIFDAGSYIDYSKNTIHAVWGYQPYAAGSKFKWFYVYKYGSEYKGPFQLPDAAVEDCHAQYVFPIPDSEQWESIIITCYTEYVPPPTVVTNGVYHLSGVMRSIDDADSPSPKYVTPRIEILATVEDGEEIILTPTKGQIK